MEKLEITRKNVKICILKHTNDAKDYNTMWENIWKLILKLEKKKLIDKLSNKQE